MVFEAMAGGQFHVIGVFSSGFILFQIDTESQKVYLMDQHAAHERIRLEKLNEEPVSVDAMLSKKDFDLLMFIRDTKPDIERTTLLTKTRACRGAVSITKILELEVIIRLIINLGRCKIPTCCAHGRPTLIELVI